MNQEQIAVAVRLVLLVFALLNQLLVGLGYSVLPVQEEELEQALTALFTIGIALWNWWEQNKTRA